MNWIWHSLQITLPDDWEMLQYSKNPEQGQCVFADRYQFRFEINWTRVHTKPDLGRLVSDYAASILENKLPEPRRNQSGSWQGLSTCENGHVITRYANYLAEASLLIEASFIYPAEQASDKMGEERILSSIKTVTTAQANYQPWKAFGLDFQVDKGLKLSHCAISCGYAEMSFSDTKQHTVHTFTRRGLLQFWLNEDIDTWLEKTIPNDFKLVSKSHIQKHGHDICNITCRPSSHTVWSDLIYGQRCLSIAAYISPKDGRLYTVSDLHRQKKSTSAIPVLNCPCGFSFSPGGEQ